MFPKIRTALLGSIVGTIACATSLNTQATDFTVEVTNLTRGIYFTPLLVAAHAPDDALFTSGVAASDSLQTMAEGGSITELTADLTAASAELVGNPADGLLAPGASTSANLNTDASPANTNLSVVAMMLPSNDGFIGLNSISIPTEAGTYTYNVNAYDAGTEANDEIRGSGAPGEAGFPAPGPVGAASGNNGTGIAADVEGFVHIHRNVIGDTDLDTGVSDIDSVVHRWLNPVARVVITVN